MSKHTPGPWIHVHNEPVYGHRGNAYVWTSKGPGHGIIADANTSLFRADEIEANARLVAASPELLDSLREVVDWATDFEASDQRTTAILNRAFAAIAKAEGRPCP
jgi:hypothetical protein